MTVLLRSRSGIETPSQPQNFGSESFHRIVLDRGVIANRTKVQRPRSGTEYRVRSTATKNDISSIFSWAQRFCGPQQDEALLCPPYYPRVLFDIVHGHRRGFVGSVTGSFCWCWPRAERAHIWIMEMDHGEPLDAVEPQATRLQGSRPHWRRPVSGQCWPIAELPSDPLTIL